MDNILLEVYSICLLKVSNALVRNFCVVAILDICLYEFILEICVYMLWYKAPNKEQG